MGTLIALGVAVWVAVAALVAVVLGAVAAQRNRQVPRTSGFDDGPGAGRSFGGAPVGNARPDDPVRDAPRHVPRDDAVPRARAPRP